MALALLSTRRQYLIHAAAIYTKVIPMLAQAFDIAVLTLQRPVTAVGGYFNYDCLTHHDMAPGGEAVSGAPGSVPPPPPPPPAPAEVRSVGDAPPYIACIAYIAYIA